MVYTHSYELVFADGKTIEGGITFNGDCKPCMSVNQETELSTAQLRLINNAIDALTALHKESGGLIKFEITKN